jgi:hypothetical protein
MNDNRRKKIRKGAEVTTTKMNREETEKVNQSINQSTH